MSNTPKKLNPEEVGLAMYKILKDSDAGWHNLLKSFLLSDDFIHIIKTLESLVNDDKRFTPPLRDVFRAFTECPFDKLKVIIVGQDPYPQLGVADGIAFSCSKTDKKEASLRYIHTAITSTVYNNEVDPATLSNDLSGWSKQGILMLNTSLTTEVGKIGKHYEIWDPFIKYLVDMLNSKSYIWALLGKKSQELEELIGEHNTILKASHPASAAYAKAKEWDCNNIFNNINLHLKQDNLPQIVW